MVVAALNIFIQNGDAHTKRSGESLPSSELAERKEIFREIKRGFAIALENARPNDVLVMGRFWFCGGLILLAVLSVGFSIGAEVGSDLAHEAKTTKPLAWPGGVVPFDVSKLEEAQAKEARRAMEFWMPTGAKIEFVPRTTEAAYVFFTGKTDAGNTSFDGCRVRKSLGRLGIA